MTYYSVLDVTPKTEDWIPDYIQPTKQLIEKHGGKYIARTAIHEQIEGDGDHPALRVIIEWPTKEAALAFVKDPEYAPYLKARTEGSISHHYLIKGGDDLI